LKPTKRTSGAYRAERSIVRPADRRVHQAADRALDLRIWLEDGKHLSRGESAIIVDYDAERETYLVEPMRDVLTGK
jgi:hypothetical protein